MSACVYNTPDCAGPVWVCRSCKREFCTTHANVTSLGANVECIDCEDKRLDPKPPPEIDLRHVDNRVARALNQVGKTK